MAWVENGCDNKILCGANRFFVLDGWVVHRDVGINVIICEEAVGFLPNSTSGVILKLLPLLDHVAKRLAPAGRVAQEQQHLQELSNQNFDQAHL